MIHISNPLKRIFNLEWSNYTSCKKKLLGNNQSFQSFANGDLFYGFHLISDGWVYREWAPEADALYLIGDFNYWNPKSHPLQKKENGNWEIFLPGYTSSKTYVLC